MQYKRNSFLIFITAIIIIGGLFLFPGFNNRCLNAAEPVMLTVFPAEGSRTGGDLVQIQGGPFTSSTVTVVRPIGAGGSYNLNIPIIRMGNNSNLEEPNDEALLTAASPRVILTGGITATYHPVSGTIELSIIESGYNYKAIYSYIPGSPIMINTKNLICGNTFYPHEELIQISNDSEYLHVEAGYVRWASIRADNPSILEFKTPSYYTTGEVDLFVRNLNNDEFNASFTYTNPLSDPRINKILREGQMVATEIINNTVIRPIRVNYKGGNTITIVGTDFRENLKIKLGDLFTIDENNIDTGVPGQISFVVPAVDEKETGELIPLQLLNTDGGLALSTELDYPVFIQYTRGDTSPLITKVSSNQGFACGGYQLTIEGDDFRREGEVYGFTGKPLVSFGGVKVPDSDVRILNSKTIEVKVPGSTPGKKNIVIENPDGEVAVLADAYTYISMPQITSVLAYSATGSSSISHVSINGGQELTIKGSGFMPGAKVIFAPGQPQDLTADDNSTNFIYLPRDTRLALQNCRFTYQGGTEGSDLIYIDCNTIRVKAPAGKLDSAGIMVVNPDAGASEIYENISYNLEELPTVQGVNAELLYNRCIKIHWNPVVNASYYEVYVRADNDNLEILGTTAENSMVYENYKDHTRYRFIIRARGDYAISLPSYSSNEIYAHQDRNNDSYEQLDTKTSIIRSGSQLLIKLGRNGNNTGLIPVNLNQSQLIGVRETVITMPADLISSYQAEDIILFGPDFRLCFNPRIFNAGLLNSSISNQDAGVRFRITAVPVSAPNCVTLSNVYQLSASLYTARNQQSIDYLSGNLQLDLNYNPSLANSLKLKTIRPARWDENTDHWDVTNGWLYSGNKQASFSLNRLGSYTVIGERR